jgi:hypothetical protein
METYHKIQTLFKRDMDGSVTGKKGKMLESQWTTPELEYLAGNEWEFTEKVDGTNIRIGWEMCTHPVFAGRSDNAVIPKPLLEYLYETFPAVLFEDTLGVDLDSKSIPVILFGEGYGPKIQGGGKYRDDVSFVLFDVKIGDFWLSRDNVNDIAYKLGIESVPVLGTGTLYQAINYVKYGTPYLDEEVETIERLMAEDGKPNWLKGQHMKSQWGDFEAEGIVARPAVDLFNRKGERIITKIKAVDFK